jgi:hypothetical protein
LNGCGEKCGEQLEESKSSCQSHVILLHPSELRFVENWGWWRGAVHFLARIVREPDSKWTVKTENRSRGSDQPQQVDGVRRFICSSGSACCCALAILFNFPFAMSQVKMSTTDDAPWVPVAANPAKLESKIRVNEISDSEASQTVESDDINHAQIPYTDLLSQLTLEEKVALLSGSDFVHSNGVSRLNIPHLKVCQSCQCRIKCGS